MFKKTQHEIMSSLIITSSSSLAATPSLLDQKQYQYTRNHNNNQSQLNGATKRRTTITKQKSTTKPPPTTSTQLPISLQSTLTQRKQIKLNATMSANVTTSTVMYVSANDHHTNSNATATSNTTVFPKHCCNNNFNSNRRSIFSCSTVTASLQWLCCILIFLLTTGKFSSLKKTILNKPVCQPQFAALLEGRKCNKKYSIISHGITTICLEYTQSTVLIVCRDIK